jgi:hypothetical protein
MKMNIDRRTTPQVVRVAGLLVVLLVAAGAAQVAQAQGPTVSVERVECIPAGANAVFRASVENDQPGTTTLLFFRRMHDIVEDLYFVQMYPEGEGKLWAVMPKAEKRKLDRHEIEQRRDDVSKSHPEVTWWRAKESSEHRNPNQDLDQDEIRERANVGKGEPRDWMNTLSDQEFETWLDSLEYEPVEYFVATFGATGDLLARSPMMVGDVRSESQCRVDLTPEQLGEAQNLIVGETAPWQRGKPVFHWLCDGVIARVGPDGVKRMDTSCRTCVPCINQGNVLEYSIGGGVSPSNF